MRSLTPRQILIGSVIATAVIEAITLVCRFVFSIRAEVVPTSDIGWLTAGIRIHHGFFGLLLLFLAMLMRQRWVLFVPWMIVLGIGLVASDFVHHFLILWPIFGDPEFSLAYPKPPDQEASARLLSWTALIYVLEWSIRIIMLVTVTATAHRRSTVSALSWLTVIFFVPELGLLIFLVFGHTNLPPWRLDRLTRLAGALKDVRNILAHHPRIIHPALDPEVQPAVRLATKLGHHPILDGNSVEVITRYDPALSRLANDIDAARDHVHLLYYIFAVDKSGSRIIHALERAARRGVTCRVLVDAVGSKAYRKKLLPRLKEAGIQVHQVLPVGLFSPKSARFDLRNHRKIAVIDGLIGYTGSQNLVDAKYKEDLTYEELVVRVTGPVVLELQYVFVSDWYLETEELLDRPCFFPDPQMAGSVAAQVLPSDPSYPQANVQRLIVALVHAARQRVVITTPYFIPDEPLMQALETAVMRGVEVHLVVSQKMDQLLVGLAQRSYYDALFDAGVQVHQYRYRFLHAKHVTFDDHITLIGSTNMDIRSFRLNAEVCLLCYDEGVTAQLRAIQEGYFRRCIKLDGALWRRRALVSRLIQNLARLFSPLL